MLEGAVFEVYAATQDNEETGSTEGIFEFGEGDFAKKYTARRIGEFMTDADGQVEVKGDDIEIDRYYILKEVTAPKGYIRSEQPILVYFAGAKDVPEDVDKNAEIIGYSYSYTVKNETYKVELPETGGIGTTVFYAAGGIHLAGAVVLLIARKRTNCMEK